MSAGKGIRRVRHRIAGVRFGAKEESTAVTKSNDRGSLGKQNFSRRQALRLGLGATAGAAAAPLIAACGSSNSSNTKTGGAAAPLPDYVPYTAPGAAIPASKPI